MIGKKGVKLAVPRVMEDCLRYLGRPDRLAEHGLFRISGDHMQMEKFKGAYQTSTGTSAVPLPPIGVVYCFVGHGARVWLA